MLFHVRLKDYAPSRRNADLREAHWSYFEDHADHFVARGATFQGFEFVTPRRHRRSGMKVLRRGGDAVMAAELRVNWAYRVWRGLPTEGRGVGRAPLDADALARTGPRLDAAAARWAAVPVGGELLWRWGVDR